MVRLIYSSSALFPLQDSNICFIDLEANCLCPEFVTASYDRLGCLQVTLA